MVGAIPSGHSGKSRVGDACVQNVSVAFTQSFAFTQGLGFTRGEGFAGNESFAND